MPKSRPLIDPCCQDRSFRRCANTYPKKMLAVCMHCAAPRSAHSFAASRAVACRARLAWCSTCDGLRDNREAADYVAASGASAPAHRWSKNCIAAMHHGLAPELLADVESLGHCYWIPAGGFTRAPELRDMPGQVTVIVEEDE